MAKYVPPKQSKIGQIIDVLTVLIMTVGALYIPLWLKLAGSAQVDHPQTNPTWESLGQNATMVDKWHQLGYADPASAASIITTRYDYSFSTIELLVMIVAIVGYYLIMLRFSEKEYRDVITEKFDEK